MGMNKKLLYNKYFKNNMIFNHNLIFLIINFLIIYNNYNYIIIKLIKIKMSNTKISEI